MKSLLFLMVVILSSSPLFSASLVDSDKVSRSVKINGILKKEAVVCRSEKSLIYLLKSEKHYQRVIDGLESHLFYKNCFLSIARAKVNVVSHYSSQYLIKNYYVINYLSKTRYVPIEFIEPVKKVKNKKSTYHKKRIKRDTKKSKYSKSKIHKYNKPKKTHKKSKRIHRHVSVKKIINTNLEYKKHKSIISDSIIDKNKHIKSNNKVLFNQSISNTMKVYKCSVVSFYKSFTGQHIDKEKSKQLAVENCKKYQTSDESLCVFDSCYILLMSTK